MRCTQVTRELILAESYFCPYVCHFCKDPCFDLRKCSSCKLVSYCSTDHQKKHWPIHRQLCTSVSKVIKSFGSANIFDVCSPNLSWTEVRSRAMSLAEANSRKTLYPAERQMFWFPAACPVCRCFTVDKSLICITCFSVSYCSEKHKIQHQTNHKYQCDKLKLSFELSRNMALHNTNLELEFISSRNKLPLPSCLGDFINQFIIYQNINNFKVIASEILTCITTIIYSIEKSQLLFEQNQLNIVVAGPEMTSGPESYIIKYLEILTHRYSDLNIKLSFIGPTDNAQKFKPIICSDCSNRNISTSFHSEFFHDFISSPDYIQPDLIIVFNCGFHENQNTVQDTWAKTISLLYDSKSLIVFTSYSENESLKDYSRFIELKPPDKEINVISKCFENPYRSIRPHWDWENDSIYYINNYISIIKIVNG